MAAPEAGRPTSEGGVLPAPAAGDSLDASGLGFLGAYGYDPTAAYPGGFGFGSIVNRGQFGPGGFGDRNSPVVLPAPGGRIGATDPGVRAMGADSPRVYAYGGPSYMNGPFVGANGEQSPATPNVGGPIPPSPDYPGGLPPGYLPGTPHGPGSPGAPHLPGAPGTVPGQGSQWPIDPVTGRPFSPYVDPNSLGIAQTNAATQIEIARQTNETNRQYIDYLRAKGVSDAEIARQLMQGQLRTAAEQLAQQERLHNADLGFGREQLGLQREAFQTNADLQRAQLAVNTMIAQGQLTVAQGQLALQQYATTGQLAIGNRQIDAQLAIAGQQFGLQQQAQQNQFNLGVGQLQLGRYSTDVGAGLQNRALDVQQQAEQNQALNQLYGQQVGRELGYLNADVQSRLGQGQQYTQRYGTDAEQRAALMQALTSAYGQAAQLATLPDPRLLDAYLNGQTPALSQSAAYRLGGTVPPWMLQAGFAPGEPGARTANIFDMLERLAPPGSPGAAYQPEYGGYAVPQTTAPGLQLAPSAAYAPPAGPTLPGYQTGAFSPVSLGSVGGGAPPAPAGLGAGLGAAVPVSGTLSGGGSDAGRIGTNLPRQAAPSGPGYAGTGAPGPSGLTQGNVGTTSDVYHALGPGRGSAGFTWGQGAAGGGGARDYSLGGQVLPTVGRALYGERTNAALAPGYQFSRQQLGEMTPMQQQSVSYFAGRTGVPLSESLAAQGRQADAFGGANRPPATTIV